MNEEDCDCLVCRLDTMTDEEAENLSVEDAIALAVTVQRAIIELARGNKVVLGALAVLSTVRGPKAVLILDKLIRCNIWGNDIDADQSGLKASMALGNDVTRFMPKHQGIDINGESMRPADGDSPGGQLAVYHLAWYGLDILNAESIDRLLNKDERELEDLSADNPIEYHLKVDPLSHAAAASVLVNRFGRHIRYTEDRRWWLFNKREGVWEHLHAKERIRLKVASLAYDYRKMYKELENKAALTDNEQREWLNFISNLGATSTLNSIMNLIAGHRSVSCVVSDFDETPNILNLADGVLLLDTGELKEHAPEFMCSMRSDIKWRSGESWVNGERPQMFENFLSDMFGKQDEDTLEVERDEEMLSYWKRASGYCLTGYTTEKRFFFLYGDGDNGKSKLTNIMRGILGSYSASANSETFMEKRGAQNSSGASSDVARLFGVRMVVTAEAEENQSFSGATIKTITGDDQITARFMQKEFFEFTPRFKLIVHGNSKPKIKGTDPAIWKRPQVLDLDVVIPEEKQIRDIDKIILEKEAALILRWMVEGYTSWKDNGLAPPPRVSEALAEYKRESDSLGLFIEERCLTMDSLTEEQQAMWGTEELKVKTTELREKYLEWCKKSRVSAGYSSPVAFGREIAKRGYERIRTGNSRYYIGIRLSQAADDDFSAMIEVGKEDEEDPFI